MNIGLWQRDRNALTDWRNEWIKENRRSEQLEKALSAYRASGLTPDELARAAELVRAEKEGKLHIGRCLECKEYEGLAVCSLIGDCGGTNFHCGWFAPRAEAEAALQKGAGGQ